ncbi:hypothetical protein GCM10018980_14100 [Streptomyces capoamus]|uniref:Uncharacterized protein n=1 Tax=Streptomyces capoamus TaxID=68183 RepID=A0A919C312_9ACTN|nr:hypothetical protein GCM10010501_20380 [Streptomyces libani subsp. rufus]GHG40091.1 hypothetical protein GCM10018980_14100 [Streptomyces capoamus]
MGADRARFTQGPGDPLRGALQSDGAAHAALRALRVGEMAARYLPEDKVAAFVEYDRANLGEHFLIYMRPEHWVAADLGAF